MWSEIQHQMNVNVSLCLLDVIREWVANTLQLYKVIICQGCGFVTLYVVVFCPQVAKKIINTALIVVIIDSQLYKD